MSALIIPFPGSQFEVDRLRAATFRNIGVAVLNECIRSGLLTLRADFAEGGTSLNGPRRFIFPIENDLIAIPDIQESSCGLLLIRTNVFDLRKIAYRGEEPELNGYRAVAAAEHWFSPTIPEWYDRERIGVYMAADPGYLPRLAAIEIEPIGYPDWTDTDRV